MYSQLSRYTSVSLAIAVSAALGACQGRRAAPAATGSAGGDVAAPAPAGATGAATGTDTAAAGTMRSDTTGGMGNLASSLKGLSDANYAALVSEANKADSAAGAFAETKTKNPRVVAFAKRMVQDHGYLEHQTLQLAHKLHLTPQPPSNDPVKQLAAQEMNALHSAQKGAAFDSTYIDHEVTVHQAVLGLLNTIESDAKNAQLKALAKKAEPVIKAHLAEAQAIQKQLKSAM